MHEKLLAYLPIVTTIAIIALSIFTALRVIIDTHNSTKTLAYLLVVLFVPLLGSIIYFSFGVNYRKKRLYSRKILADDRLFREIVSRQILYSKRIAREEKEKLLGHEDMVTLLINESRAPLSRNRVTILINGEEKFPEVAKTLESAVHFIHIEYYIFSNDRIGREIAAILKKKAREGVAVRLIYDDFGSHGIKRNLVKELQAAGVKVYPFYEIRLFFLANRINYRDHRKIIIVDGKVGFIGGINVSDRYINDGIPGKLFWRDTHLKIEGPAVSSLQFNFIASWNFCSGENVEASPLFFPLMINEGQGEDLVQVVGSGPDYPRASIMLSYFSAIVSAADRVYISSPYFIPNDSICDALQKAALSGKDVRLLVPGVSDSRLVDAAARSYYGELLASGVRIFRYKKGFIHAKTMLVDNNLAIIGTANFDSRSFELNFEINAVVYSMRICDELRKAFLSDMEDSEEIHQEQWKNRGRITFFEERLARLVSPLL